MLFSTLLRPAPEQIWSDSHGWLTVVKEERRVGAMRVLRCSGRFGETVWVSRKAEIPAKAA